MMQNAMLLYAFFVCDMVPTVSHSYKAKSAGEIVIVNRNIKALQIHFYFERVVVKLIKISILSQQNENYFTLVTRRTFSTVDNQT